MCVYTYTFMLNESYSNEFVTLPKLSVIILKFIFIKAHHHQYSHGLMFNFSMGQMELVETNLSIARCLSCCQLCFQALWVTKHLFFFYRKLKVNNINNMVVTLFYNRHLPSRQKILEISILQVNDLSYLIMRTISVQRYYFLVWTLSFEISPEYAHYSWYLY